MHHVLHAVVLVDFVEEFLFVKETPLMQLFIQCQEPFAKVPCSVILIGRQKHGSLVEKLAQVTEGLQALHHLKLRPLVKATENVVQHCQKARGKVLQLPCFDGQEGCLLVWDCRLAQNIDSLSLVNLTEVFLAL